MDLSKVKIVMFDTFGTVVDWHSSVVNYGEKLAAAHGVSGIDWHAFANVWREEGYIRVMNEVARGERPWEPVDVLHERKLRQTVAEYGLPFTDEEIVDFSLIWHRLTPWADAVPGLYRLKTKYMIGPFSNGDFRLLMNMGKNSDLPWDFVLAGQQFEKFKPDPTIYEDAVRLLGDRPEEVLMVAAHLSDLDGAHAIGCPTFYVPRPLEYGEVNDHVEPPARFEHEWVADFGALADRLGV
ncbi:MAG: haloacid dehalogenase type II [Christensenellaceae bacterium]|nr:haloacid dehalogenase type II [Christensenellaceae bacterium]